MNYAKNLLLNTYIIIEPFLVPHRTFQSSVLKIKMFKSKNILRSKESFSTRKNLLWKGKFPWTLKVLCGTKDSNRTIGAKERTLIFKSVESLIIFKRNTPRNAIDKQLLHIATSGFVIILAVKQITETEQSLVEVQLYLSAKNPYISTFCKTFPSIPHTFQLSSSLRRLLWDQSQDLLTSTNSGSHLKANDHILTLPSQSLHLKHNT